jgi:hypothetical protein
MPWPLYPQGKSPWYPLDRKEKNELSNQFMVMFDIYSFPETNYALMLNTTPYTNF